MACSSSAQLCAGLNQPRRLPSIIGPTGIGLIPWEHESVQNLEDIAVFVKVVDAGSFTGAAAALETSQPVVSKGVTRLEQRLGVRLMNRTTRRISLTEAGSELYRFVRARPRRSSCLARGARAARRRGPVARGPASPGRSFKGDIPETGAR